MPVVLRPSLASSTREMRRTWTRGMRATGPQGGQLSLRMWSIELGIKKRRETSQTHCTLKNHGVKVSWDDDIPN